MTLKEFRESSDRNIFWTLTSGETQNLLDEAIEIIEKYEKQQSYTEPAITILDKTNPAPVEVIPTKF